MPRLSWDGCEDAEVRTYVDFVKDRWEHWPKEIEWPQGGIVLVRQYILSNGPDSSLASEDGCKLSAARLADGIYDFRLADAFLPVSSLDNIDRSSLTPEQAMLEDVEDHLFVLVQE